MNLVCVICSDLLIPSDDVFHTPCGHIFHFTCLVQWLERSRTCPQCREKTTEQKIHRIYFNFANNDNIVEDSTSLQNRIDNLTFQLKLRDKNINNLTEDKEKLQKQTAGLRREVRLVESEINGKNSAIHALKEQIKFHKQQSQDADNYKKEIEQLKKEIEKLRNLQALIDDSVDEVDDTISMTCDKATLLTYITVMKREMKVSFKKRRELRDKVKSSQQELTHLSTKCKRLSEEHIKRKELEEQLMICETDKISLQAQLLNLQENTRTCLCNKKFAEQQKDSKVGKECGIEYSIGEENNTQMNQDAMKLDDTLNLKKNDSCIIVDSSSIENTPESIKSQGFFSMKDRGIKRERSNNILKVPSILAKKSKFSRPSQNTVNDMTFDGFGGHAKYEKFPNPIPNSHIKKIREEAKTKKSKLDTGDNQKLNDIMLIY